MNLPRRFLPLAFVMIMVSGAAAAQSGDEVFASSNLRPRVGTDSFSASLCKDAQIAVAEGRDDAHAYRDITGKVKQAADYLATKYRDPYINRASVCKHARGSVFLIPNHLKAEFLQVLQMLERQPTPAPSDKSTTAPPSTELSSSGCPYPHDIAPSKMSPMIPLQARINSAEAVFKQRLRLCQQGRGNLVRGGCTTLCYNSHTANPSGSKNIGRTVPHASPTKPATNKTLDKAIDSCFTRFMPDYQRPDWQDFAPEALVPQPEDPIHQSLFISRVGAENALKIDEAANGAWDDRELMLDHLMGWLTHCMTDSHALPMADPRPAFRRYADLQLEGATPARMKEHNSWFATGYFSYPLPPFWDRKPQRNYLEK